MPSEEEITDSISTSPSLNSPNDVMITKIENSNQLGNKKHALALIAKILFNNGYETTFIAGILANIKHEGNFGFFESSCYKSHPESKPKYFKIMEELGYGYDEKYSSKCVTDVSLLELKKFVDKLENDNWKRKIWPWLLPMDW